MAGSSTTMSLTILLSLQDAASQAIGGIGDAIMGLATGDPLQAVAGIEQSLMAVGQLVVGFGQQSVETAAQYQQSMNMVQALTGSSGQQMQWYNQQVQNLAVNAGAAPNDLAQGLYNVLSASYKGSEAMNVLTLATEDSKIGMTDATTTTDSLTNILRSFSVSAKNVTATNGEMLETVTLGKATFEQYATTIVKAASSSVQFHVSMETMNAAWSTMTSSGIKAAQASTDYQQSLKVMYGNIGTVTKSLEKNGIAFDEAKFNTMTYGQKVMYLNQALTEANDKHVKITGVTIQASQAISTIAQHIGNYNSNLATLSNKQQMAEKTQNAWKITQQGFNQQLSEAQAAFQVLEINVGNALLPVLTKLVKQLTPIIMSFVHWLIQSHALQNGIQTLIGIITKIISVGEAIYTWFTHNQTAMTTLKVLVIALGVAIGVFLLAALILIGITLASVAVAFAICIAPIVGLIWVIQHWGQIMAWIRGVIQAAIAFLVGIFQAGIQRIVGWFSWLYNHNYYFKMLVDFLKKIIADVIAFFTAGWERVVHFATQLWQRISSIFSSAWNTFLQSPLGHLLTSIQGWFEKLPGMALQWGINLIKSFVSGILSQIGTVAKAASSVIGKIGSFLGFHSPAKEGPGTELDAWPRNLVASYARGLQGSIPMLQASLGLLMHPVAQSLSSAPGAGMSGSGGAAAAGGGVVINLNIQARVIDRRTIKEIMEQIASELRGNGVLSSLATGGTH